MKVLTNFLTDLHDLALRLAPELAAAPLYLINQPVDVPTPADAGAYVSQSVCEFLRPAIGDQWRGPGPVVVFVEDAKEAIAQAILIHELAHILPQTQIPETRVTPAAEFAAWCESPGQPSAKLPLWFPDHGRDFTRTALHLWWRASLQNIVVDLDPLCGGLRYDLSPAYCYWRALGNEALRMRDATFTEILLTDPPQMFSDCWKADFAYWMKNNPKTVEEVRTKHAA